MEVAEHKKPQVKRPKHKQISDRLADALNKAAKSVGAGAPRRSFDLAKVEECGKLNASYREMASLFATAEKVIHSRMNEVAPESPEQGGLLPDDWGKFLIAYESGRTSVCRALRSKQIQLALAGDRPLLIHLGQHLLGQIPISALDIKQAITGDFEFTIKANPDEEPINITPPTLPIEDNQ
jgi:hypothetical protein